MIHLRKKRRINRAPCRKGGQKCTDATPEKQGGIAVFGGSENKTWDDPDAENKAPGEKGPSWGG